MKRTLTAIIFIVPLLVGGQVSRNEKTGKVNNEIIIMVNKRKFSATLENSATANAFRELLPLTLKMTELNGNEKYFELPVNLPAKAARPGTIIAGDLMLWGSNTLVLFYETFSTSYSYTKIGKINDPGGLSTALGAGGATVVFEDQP